MKYYTITKHRYLTAATRAFERAAPRFCDFWLEHGAERDFRDAPAPFWVEEYSTVESHVRECPDYDHDCSREGCGTSWSTGGESGVLLRDATGRVWRDAGVIVEGGIGI